ncbi:MAG: response regulator transcription factor [Bacteroidaceae bacterium]|nr:response regulator transcription factor [Bacteroidaceae bacterium]
MKVLIVEDETAAFDNLVSILASIDPMIEIMGNTEGVAQTVRWLKNNPKPDLIFMDIHLSDGSAFAIFSEMEVEVPIIFTTAYDQYAIDAFKVNSVDYLLKPIHPDDVKMALQKFQKLGKTDIQKYLEQLAQLSVAPTNRYRDKLIVQYRDTLLPIPINDVAFFYYTDHKTSVTLTDGRCFSLRNQLEQIFTTLNPANFIRANRQFIINRESVLDISVWFDGRLRVNMKVEVPESIYISKNRASEFKLWMEKI